MSLLYFLQDLICKDPPAPGPGGISTFDPQTQHGKMSFDSVVEYSCQKGQMLLSKDGKKYEKQFLSCNWDTNWTPEVGIKATFEFRCY